MATYINGLTDYIPQVQPFKPDYNFYAGVLQQKQSQYDQNYNQINSVYGSLLNSPMTKDINNKRRDDYFKMADNAIKKISGLDLSLEENADQAYGVFKPFYSDNNMMKDMTWTKNYNNEVARGESFRNCIDPKKCGGQYSDVSMAALNYKRDEFRNTDDQQALGFDNVRFVPQVNVFAKASEAAKAAGFSIKMDKLNGGYIVTTKNGQLLEPHLQSYFAGLFGNDSAITDWYKTKAYVQRKDFIAQNMQAGIDPRTAEEMYIKTFTGTVIPQQEKEKQQAITIHDGLKTKKAAIDADIENNGVIVNAENVKAYGDIIDQLTIAEAGKTHYEQSQNHINAVKNSSNTSMMMNQVDSLVAMHMFDSEINSVAHDLAYVDYEQTMKADPFALQSQASALSLKNSLTMKNADYTMWVAKQNYLTHKEDAKRMGSAEKNNPTYVEDAPGWNTPPSDKNQTFNINKDINTKLVLGNASSKEDYVLNLANTIKDQYIAASTANEKELIKASANKLFEGTGIKPEQLFTKNSDVVNLIKSGTKNKNNVDASTIYDRSLTLIDPNAPVFGSINKWASSFWKESEGQRADIKNKDILINSSQKFFKDQGIVALNQMKGKIYDNDPKENLYLDHFLDDAGQPKSKEEFIKSVVQDPKIVGSYKQEVKPSNILGTRGTQTIIETPETQAGRKAMKDYDEYYKNYRESYTQTARPFNGLLASGNRGGGLTARPMQFNDVDPYEYKAPITLQTRSFFKDYQRLANDPGTKVFFGETDKENPVTDPKALAILNQVITEFGQNYDKPTVGRPRLNVRYQGVAGNSEKNIALRITLNEDFTKKYKNMKGDQGLTGTPDLAKGVVIYLPSDKESNAFTEATEVSIEDMILEQTGQLTFNQDPRIADVTLSKKDNKYYINGYTTRVNPTTGDLEKVAVTTPSTYATLSGSQMSDMINAGIAKTKLDIQNDIEILKANGLGTKNPQDLQRK